MFSLLCNFYRESIGLYTVEDVARMVDDFLPRRYLEVAEEVVDKITCDRELFNQVIADVIARNPEILE